MKVTVEVDPRHKDRIIECLEELEDAAATFDSMANPGEFKEADIALRHAIMDNAAGKLGNQKRDSAE